MGGIIEYGHRYGHKNNGLSCRRVSEGVAPRLTGGVGVIGFSEILSEDVGACRGVSYRYGQ